MPVAVVPFPFSSFAAFSRIAKRISSQPFASPNPLSAFLSKYSSPVNKFYCAKKGRTDGLARPQGFSVLSLDSPWDSRSVWSTMALYFFSLHIPLSFGGLSVVAAILHEPTIDTQTEAVSLLLLQSTELLGAFTLLQYTAKPQYEITRFFMNKKLGERSWVLASALGSGFLLVLVVLTSLLADILIGPKDVNNPTLKEILLSGSVAQASCFFTYCFITPVLEETIYRGFLLATLATKMEWWRAVVVSSAVFAAAHLSLENSLQLFVIGSVLGCAYCWTGSLVASFAIHAAYNAAMLLATFLS